MALTIAARSVQEIPSPTPEPAAPPLHASASGNTLRLTASSAWTVRNFARLDESIKALQLPATSLASAEIDLTAIDDLDTAGALLLDRLHRDLEGRGILTHTIAATNKQRILLAVVRDNASPAADRPLPQRTKPITQLAKETAGTLLETARDAARLTAFLGETTLCASRVIAQPWRFRWISFMHHIEHVGLRAVPIISLICILIGAVITQQGIVQLREFRAEPFAIDMLGILALREVGILLTAIVVAGRSASAFTAEIGSMKMREEIDAMRALGLDPMELLVLPRIAALIVILPVLAFIGDIMCLVGGAAMALVYLDVDLAVYVQRLHDAISLRHFAVGLVKAPLAALIIGLVGCREGLAVSGSAESLGLNVTGAVVKAIFLVIVFDALFAMFLSACGF